MAHAHRASEVVDPHRRTQTRFIVYQSLTSFLSGACNPGVLSGSSEVAVKVRGELNRYLISMPSEDIIGAVISSIECRKFLLGLSSALGVAEDIAYRTAVRADEEQVAAHVSSILDSESATTTVLSLQGERAQCFLDVAQDVLDRGFLIGREHTLQRIIRKLSETSDTLPSSLFITGVSGKGDEPTFGGAFGDIYRASYNGKAVALKRIRHFTRGSESRSTRSKFGREALLWKELDHPNILPFLGIDRESFPSSLCMVSPWMDNGTVVSFLKDHGRTQVDALLYQIAQGLEYLHSRNIVHGDLHGGNILITSDWQACLADFGLSIFSDVTASTSSARAGSLRWMAPELIHPDQFGSRFARTPASDIYAFGCVCFELYTGKPPFAELSESAALLKVLKGDRPERPTGTPLMSNTLWKNVTLYWTENPSARPSAQTVVQNMAPPLPRPQTQISIPSPLTTINSAGSTPRVLQSLQFQVGPQDLSFDERGGGDLNNMSPISGPSPPYSVGFWGRTINHPTETKFPVQRPFMGSTQPSSSFSPVESNRLAVRQDAPLPRPLSDLLLHSNQVEGIRVQTTQGPLNSDATTSKEKGKSRWWPWGNSKDRDNGRDRQDDLIGNGDDALEQYNDFRCSALGREAETLKVLLAKVRRQREDAHNEDHKLGSMREELLAEDEQPITRHRGEENELTRKIGFLTATASEDWTLVLDVCDHASANEDSAKEAVRAIRREFKYGEPAPQLAAARLWAIMLQISSDFFVSQCTSRKFLDTLEDLLTSSRTSPVVRERVMDIVGAAAYASGTEKDVGFRKLWRRVKPKDKPEEGVPFDMEDAMFNPPPSAQDPWKYDPSRLSSNVNVLDSDQPPDLSHAYDGVLER